MSAKTRSSYKQHKKTYESQYANVHRGIYYLSQIATDAYENARLKVRNFLNAEILMKQFLQEALRKAPI